MTFLLAALSYGITIAALVLISVKGLELYRLIKRGQSDPTRSSHKGRRLALMTREVLGHTKMLNFTGTGIAHWFVMVGFGALLGTLITAFGQVINPKFAIPWLGTFVPYLWLVESITWLTGKIGRAHV